MKKSQTKIRVRYGETDQMGFVYHGNYTQYFEMGRIAWLEDLGFSYKKMEEDGIIMPVIYLEIDFKNTAHYDDELTIITKLIAKPTAMIKFSYEVLNNAGDIIAIAKTDLVFLDKATKKPIRCPDFILDHL